MCSLLCSVIIELLFITGFTLHYWRLQWNIIWLDLWVWFAAYSWVDTPTTAILMDKNTWDSTQALERETPSCIEVFFPSLQEGFSLMNCGTPCLSCFTHQVPCHYFYGIDETPSKTYVFARVLFGSDDTEKSSESTSHGSFFDPSRWSSIRFPLWDHIYILNHVEHCTLCVVHVTMKILYYSLLINYYSMSSFSLRHPTYPHLSPFQTASSPCGPGEIANMIGLTRPYTEITYVRYLHWAVPNILVGSLRVFWYIVINSYIYIYTLYYILVYTTHPFLGWYFG